MSQILILGSGFAVPNAEHENTHMLLRTAQRTVLIDCASNPMQRLPQAGVNFDEISDIIVTHFHPGSCFRFANSLDGYVAFWKKKIT